MKNIPKYTIIEITQFITIISGPIVVFGISDQISKLLKFKESLIGLVIIGFVIVYACIWFILWYKNRDKFISNKWTAILISLIVFLVICQILLSYQKRITIDYPIAEIKNNLSEIGGKFYNIDKSYLKNYLKIFVHPLDGYNAYWLNLQNEDINILDENWSLLCRFGDEIQIANATDFPIKFVVYAIVLKNDVQFPYNKENNKIIANNEKTFFKKIEKYSIYISEKFVIKRIDQCFPPPIFEAAIKSNKARSRYWQYIPSVLQSSEKEEQVKLHWEKDMPMYVEIYKNGIIDLNLTKYYNKGEVIFFNRENSTIYYHIKLRERENYKKYSSIWFIHFGEYKN